MPSNRTRLRRQACAESVKLRGCKTPQCKRNHSLLDSALLEHLANHPRSQCVQESNVTLEFTTAAGSAPWHARAHKTIHDGPTVLAAQSGASPQEALCKLLDGSDRLLSWSPRSRTLCAGHREGRCSAGMSCNQSHSLFEPEWVTSLVANHAYPGRSLKLSYTASASPLLGMKWQLSIDVPALNAGLSRPAEEVSVVHEDFNTALRLLQTQLLAGVIAPAPEYNTLNNEPPLVNAATDHASTFTNRIVADFELPPAYTPDTPLVQQRFTPTSLLGEGQAGSPADHSLTSFAEPAQEEPDRRGVLATPTVPHHANATHSHPYYNAALYAHAPGNFPWTAWEMWYWLAKMEPPRSRRERLNNTYGLGLPPEAPSATASRDGMDIIDEVGFWGPLKEMILYRLCQFRIVTGARRGITVMAESRIFNGGGTTTMS